MAKIKAKRSEEETNVKKKSKKIKETKIRTEEGETLHRFIIIFIVIVVLVLAIYLISGLVSNNKNSNNTTAEETEVEINYDNVNVGMILNRDQYDKYYVMLYDADSENALYYSALMTTYKNKEEHEKLFYCDLGNPLNKDYVQEESNPKAQKTEDFAFGEITLLEIQKGKITRYVEDIDTIKDILQ